MPDTRKSPSEHSAADPAVLAAMLRAHAGAVENFCLQAKIARWNCPTERFTNHLARSVASRFKTHTPSWEEVDGYLGALHLEDFALACACADGVETAWDVFVGDYREYLRRSAAAMLRRGAESAEACELADSLFAELYGLADGRRGTSSLFRYFHGRSSLKTWLRAVLAQRHVDSIRAARRFDSLDEEDGSRSLDHPQTNSGAAGSPTPGRVFGPETQPPDPYREKYIAMFCDALRSALERLEPADHRRLSLYYSEGKTLAEIGRLCGEHESSVSRNLERIRRELRVKVEEHLRRDAPGLSDAQMALCFQYATEDAPIDFDLLFPGDGRVAARKGDASQNKTVRRGNGETEV
jgi:RNA polymerase sigma-70 factor, ECF subfamily